MTGFLQREGAYNPDVLSCLANLSNDEVFTSPALANQMIDLLPPEIFRDPKTTFLDPACKTGVFLREIAKRLMTGLAKAIPDENERREHIFKKQLFGIAITELTALMSRRSVYCSKNASCKYSVVKFASPAGNIRFKLIRHSWENGRCKYCGASQRVNDRGANLETHAYEFIHTLKAQEIFNMHFDVIIGNPPYQMEDGGGMGSAVPIYNLFIDQAKKLRSRHLIMIVPSRWFSGGRGLDDFRDNMLQDKSIREIVDYPVSSECFPGVEIKGGVCYFHREEGHENDCLFTTIRGGKKTSMNRPLLEKGCDTLIRFNEAIPILHKVQSKHEESFSKIVSAQKPFGFRTYVTGSEKPFHGAVKIYANKAIGFVRRNEITQHTDWISKHKVYITAAYGAGEDFPHQIINKPLYGEPNSCCTETYIVVGVYDDETTARNVISYMTTRFFRFLVLLKKNTQHASASVYSFVPMQDFSKPWSDKELYAKYGLAAEEIGFIESMIRPMEAGE